MAGIVSASVAQIAAARVAVAALQFELERLANGPYPDRLALGTAQITAIDAKVDAAVAAIAPLNT